MVKVIALQGTMEYFGSSHRPYAIAALLVLFFFILPLPLLLLFYPLSNKVVSWLGLDDNYLVWTCMKFAITRQTHHNKWNISS